MSIHQIIGAMRQLENWHQELIELGKAKQKSIIENDSSSLTKLMSAENRLLKQITKTEELRVEAVAAFLKEKGIRSQLDLTVTELSRLVFDQNDKRDLLEERDQLLNSVAELKKQNEATQQLIEHSLHFIDFSLNLLVGVDEDMIYHKPSDASTISNKNSFFDAKA